MSYTEAIHVDLIKVKPRTNTISSFDNKTSGSTTNTDVRSSNRTASHTPPTGRRQDLIGLLSSTQGEGHCCPC